ncbi:hypothetical protein V6245_02695 [Salinibacterium amurskyense]|uniref:hypothetical protein n=1 Tax=Salinibacterium amurskyense TaxID=205941 RepID=UPI00311D4657
MTEQIPEESAEPVVDDQPDFPWLTVAIVAQSIAVAWSLFPASDASVSLVMAGIFNFGLLILLKRGQGWARRAFLTLSIWSIAIRSLSAFLEQYLPNDSFNADWANILLTAIAAYAVFQLTPPSRTPEARP